jgi:hypothetical protein
MFSFVLGGYHLGLLLRQVSMSLTIGLVFGICESNNGEVSLSIWVFLLWTSYVFSFLLCIQNYKMSIFTELSFVDYLFFLLQHFNFFYDSFPFNL